MSEEALLQIRAAVYNYFISEWMPADDGLSNVGIYFNRDTDMYRIVAMDSINNSVVINTRLFKELTYAECSSVFHQWSDAEKVYGLNFASVEDAVYFKRTLLKGVNDIRVNEGFEPLVLNDAEMLKVISVDNVEIAPSVDKETSRDRRMVKDKKKSRRRSGKSHSESVDSTRQSKGKPEEEDLGKETPKATKAPREQPIVEKPEPIMESKLQVKSPNDPVTQSDLDQLKLEIQGYIDSKVLMVLEALKNRQS